MLVFDEEKHEYTLNGKKLISVTQLMQKHGLAPSYAGVSTEILNAKAERGTLIHKEIEDFIKEGKIGFTNELTQFIQYLDDDINIVASELRLNNDVVAGTCDLILDEKGQCIIADIKTTYQLHLEPVSWQLSIYLYLYVQDKKHIKYSDFKGQAFHFNKEGQLNVIDIPLQPYEEVKILMDCERDGDIYQRKIAIDDNKISEIASLEQVIKSLDQQQKEVKAKQEELKKALIQEMEERNLKTFEKNGVKITYVAPGTRITLDSKGIKEKYPDIYKEFSKTSETSASLRITMKGE